MRAIIALALAFPLYATLELGWQYFLIMGLQLLAGLDFKMSKK